VKISAGDGTRKRGERSHNKQGEKGGRGEDMERKNQRSFGGGTDLQYPEKNGIRGREQRRHTVGIIGGATGKKWVTNFNSTVFNGGCVLSQVTDQDA